MNKNILECSAYSDSSRPNMVERNGANFQGIGAVDSPSYKELISRRVRIQDMYSPYRFIQRLLFNKRSAVFTVIVSIGLFVHFCLSGSVSTYLQPVGDVLFSKEAGVLAAVVAVVLSTYQFVYLRPEMFLDAEIGDTGYTEGQGENEYTAVLKLYLVNGGNQFAEDVQLTFALDAFKFDTDLDTPEHPTDDYEISTTTLDTRSGRRIGFSGAGIRHDISFENVVYEKDVHKLYYGKAIFEREGTHEIKYTVACRSHGLRQGKITLEMQDGDITVTKAYPTLMRQLKAYFGLVPDLQRTQRVENIDHVTIRLLD